MTLEAWALLAAIGAAVFSVGVSTVAILRCYLPPQTRVVGELRGRVEDAEDDLDRVHGRLNERAARANMDKARERKHTKADVAAEATEILRERLVPGGSTSEPLDVEAQRIALRNRLNKLQ